MENGRPTHMHEHGIHSEWPSVITQYPSSFVFNADENGLYFRALPEHTYTFKN